MQLRRHARVALIATTLIAVVAAPAGSRRSPAQTGNLQSPGARQIADTRERVRVSPAERDAILAEMRTMLQSLSAVMQGLVAGDVDMVQNAARASGMATALDSSLQGKLPPHFRQLGVRTHKRFDELADGIKTGVARDTGLKRLAAIAASCVTCHDTYRLDEARE